MSEPGIVCGPRNDSAELVSLLPLLPPVLAWPWLSLAARKAWRFAKVDGEKQSDRQYFHVSGWFRLMYEWLCYFRWVVMSCVLHKTRSTWIEEFLGIFSYRTAIWGKAFFGGRFGIVSKSRPLQMHLFVGESLISNVPISLADWHPEMRTQATLANSLSTPTKSFPLQRWSIKHVHIRCKIYTS